jgi:hypothetical protein
MVLARGPDREVASHKSKVALDFAIAAVRLGRTQRALAFQALPRGSARQGGQERARAGVISEGELRDWGWSFIRATFSLQREALR